MPIGLVILCLLTLPLAGGLLVLGARLRRRDTPIDRPIRSPEGGVITDPQQRLGATHRIGRAATGLGLGLIVATGFMIWQDWRAGRLSGAGTVTRIGANCDNFRLADCRSLGLLRIVRNKQGVSIHA
ncbi:MAG: hypothetical protein ACKOPO_03860 [Novosphingobium sp.]